MSVTSKDQNIRKSDPKIWSGNSPAAVRVRNPVGLEAALLVLLEISWGEGNCGGGIAERASDKLADIITPRNGQQSGKIK